VWPGQNSTGLSTPFCLSSAPLTNTFSVMSSPAMPSADIEVVARSLPRSAINRSTSAPAPNGTGAGSGTAAGSSPSGTRRVATDHEVTSSPAPTNGR
jgi:hypothetical protein